MLTQAIANLRPGINFANLTGELEDIRFDPPLPEDFTPPTAEEVEAEIARLSNPVPAEVRAAPLMLALAEAGKLDAIDAAVEQFAEQGGEEGRMAQRLWNRAGFFGRSDPLVAVVATAAGMNAEAVDAVFRRAAAIPAER